MTDVVSSLHHPHHHYHHRPAPSSSLMGSMGQSMAMTTRSSDGTLPRGTGHHHPLPDSPLRGLNRKRAPSLASEEGSRPRSEDLSPNLPRSSSPRSGDSGKDQICLCTPAPKVPRPRNAFILFRQHYQGDVVAQNPGLANPEISKIIGEQWREQPEEVKARWKKLAEEEKQRHQRQYPDYRYQPRRGGKAGAARPPSASGDDPGRCPKCGGRYIATPRTPSASFAAPTPARPAMAPFTTPNPRVIETDHLRSHPTPSHGDMNHGRSSYYPQAIREIDEDYEPISPIAEVKRRRFNDHPGHYQSASSPSQYTPHNLPHYVRAPSMSGPPPGSAPSYTSTGPLPGPAMLTRSGPMPPPPPPPTRASYVDSPRTPGFDESLRLPPLQTPLSTSPPLVTDAHSLPSASFATGLGISHNHRESQSRNLEASVMEMPYAHKLAALNTINPPLPALDQGNPDASTTRGAVIAVEGSNPELLKEVGQIVERVLIASGECAVRVWQNQNLGLNMGETSAKPQEDGSEHGGEEQSPKARRASVVTAGSGSSGASRPASNNPFGAYMQLIMEWQAKSEEITKHVTTAPSRPSIAGSSPSSCATADGHGGQQYRAAAAVDEDRSSSAETHATLCQSRVPVALLPAGFSLTVSDRFACSVPIADHYQPVDHWLWMATMWRGIVGADLVVYVLGDGVYSEDEMARLAGGGGGGGSSGSGVEFKSNGLVVVRVQEGRGRGAVDEKTERRLGFEIMEWIRSGSFRDGPAGGNK